MPGRFRGTRGAPRRTGRPLRPMDWVGSYTLGLRTTAAGAQDSVYLVLPSEVRQQFTDPTLMRTRGEISLISGTANAKLVHLGILPWEDTNDVAPVPPDIPSPTNMGLDWIWHLSVMSAGAAALQRSDVNGSPGVINVDSRAMRRLGGSKGILLILENAVGAGDVSILFKIRCLIKD